VLAATHLHVAVRDTVPGDGLPGRIAHATHPADAQATDTHTHAAHPQAAHSHSTQAAHPPATAKREQR